MWGTTLVAEPDVDDRWDSHAYPDLHIYSTVPRDDVIEHKPFSRACICGPSVDRVMDGFHVVGVGINHNAWDGRVTDIRQ